MELREDVDGWICSKRAEAMLHKKVGLCGKNGKREAINQVKGWSIWV